jgi:hypothetical protein
VVKQRPSFWVVKTVVASAEDGLDDMERRSLLFRFAKALKKNGVDEALIAKSLGLTIEEVRAL